MGQVIKNGAAFLEGTRPLDEALHVSGPYKADSAPNAYSFERTNTIKVDWAKVLAKADFVIPKTNSDQLRMYVQRAWGLAPGDALNPALIDANVFDLSDTWPAYVHLADSVQNAVATKSDLITIFRSIFRLHRRVPTASEVLEIKKGCVLQIKRGKATRWYQPVVDKDAGPTYPAKADFAPDKWEDTWSTVTAMVQVYFPGPTPANPADAPALQNEAKAEAKQFFPAVDLIRADAATIRRQYRMLMNEKPLVAALDKKAEDVANQIPNVPFDVIPSLTAQFRELKNFGIELDGRRRQLADAASDLNYQLFLEKTKLKFYEDGTGNPVDAELDEGELYVKSSKTASWVTFQTVTRSSSSFFGLSKSSSSYQVPVYHAKTYDYYEKAVVDHDPWVEILDFYKSQSFEVYLFRFTSRGLIAADGSSPQDILDKCEKDELFRRRCVIALPHKEVTLIGETFIVGYHLFVRPVPDIVITTFPVLSLKEQLSYRFTWMGVALGNLAATIPLSPGEEREVTLATSQRYESSRTETASSLVDITHIDKSDFETVFEKEVRKENETSTTFGTSASGSYAGIVSGSANFSTTKTTKEVARQLNRSVQRASQEVNRRSKEERTVTISEKIETTQQNSTTFRVKNINQGSTLNIAFYRLYNAFQSLLKVDNFNYMVRAGRSPIASVDILDEKVFDRDSFANLLAYIKNNFPFDLSKLDEVKWQKFEAELRAQILEAYKEYKEEPPGGKQEAIAQPSHALDDAGSAVAAPKADPLAKLDDLAARFRGFGEAASGSAAADASATPGSQADWAGMLREQRMEEDTIIGIPLWQERTNFAYDSGGLYADVYIGQRPATEPYAEAMRRLEEQKVANENNLIAARARYLNARAARQVLALTDTFDAKKMRITDRDVLIMDDGHPQIKVRLVPGILSFSGWALTIKDTAGLTGGSFLQSSSEVEGILVFELPRRFVDGGIADKDPAWFKSNVAAHNADLGITVAYVP